MTSQKKSMKPQKDFIKPNNKKLKINRNKTKKIEKSTEVQSKIPDDLWFLEDIDATKVKDSIRNDNVTSEDSFVRKGYEGVTKAIAIDCEFVGVGWNGKRNMLARVSIVNHNGIVLLDKYVKPKEDVTDYRTEYSGIRKQDIYSKKAINLNDVVNEVADIIKGRILVGHAIQNDLKALFLDHPRKLIRDTSAFPGFRIYSNNRIPSLRLLTEKILGKYIQTGEHSSIVDAQATMRLYQHVKHEWESSLRKDGRYIKQDGKPTQAITDTDSPAGGVSVVWKNKKDMTAKEKHELYCKKRNMHRQKN